MKILGESRTYRKRLQAWKKQMNSIGHHYCSGYDCKNETDGLFLLCDRCRSRILKSTRKRTETGKMFEYWAKPENRKRQLITNIKVQAAQKAKDPILHQMKTRARGHVQRALKSGLINKTPCEKCGSHISIQAHHHLGYTKEHELDIQWLCARCHAAIEGRVYA